MTELVCTSCEVAIPTFERTEHYGSEWHRYNVKRKVAGLAHIPQELFLQKLEQLKTMQANEKAAKTSQRCNICNKSFPAAAYEQHLTSKRHLSRAAKKTSVPASVSSTAEGSNTTPDTTTDTASKPEPMREEGANDTKEGKEGAGIDEAEFEFDESKILPKTTCFFCNKSCKTVQKSLKHMLKKHGFFVPFIEYLTDLDGMLEYFGGKVGHGMTCFSCNKPYESVEAVQSHMKDKNHCRIRTFGDDTDDAFWGFYNLPNKDYAWEDEGDEGDGDTNMKETQTDTTDTTDTTEEKKEYRRRLAGMNDAGELIMTDGAIIGHRSLNRAYKQNTRPTTQREEIIALMGNYRSLQLDGYNGDRKKHFNEVQHKYQQRVHREQLKYQFRANNIARFVDATLS